ncbi:MAG: hypothetical protein SW833_11505 [Cyanobacteriota bacterium]|nr:hypothetical protein [Cyanobacteriota bacterium]
MMAAPHTERSMFGMITNGSEILFVKLNAQGSPQYDLSSIFSPVPLRNELYTVLQVLKRIGQRMV